MKKTSFRNSRSARKASIESISGSLPDMNSVHNRNVVGARIFGPHNENIVLERDVTISVVSFEYFIFRYCYVLVLLIEQHE